MDDTVDTSWMTRNRSAVIAGAAVLPLLLSSLLSIFRDSLATTTSVLVLMLVVVALAATGDRQAGVVAALSSGVWFDFFLTQPYGRFSIDDSADIEATLILVLVGLGVTELALWGRRQQANASRSSGYLDGVIGTSKLISADHTAPEALTQQVAHQLIEVLGIETCRFVSGRGPGPNAAVLEQDGQVARLGRRINIERDGFPTDQEVALVVEHAGVVHGHFLLTCASRIVRPSSEQLDVAVLLGNQVGMALTRGTT